MTSRSYLFVPADRPERFAKALASGADVVVIDLEDAVAPAAKEAARAAIEEWLPRLKARVVVRINGPQTPWFDADIALVRALDFLAVMVPKAERASDLGSIPHDRLLPLIETAAGIDALREVAQAERVERLVFGSLDLQADLGITGDGEELLLFRSQLVLQSRLAGLPGPIDGICQAIDDVAATEMDARRARRLGFAAKLCIHPKQVSSVNLAFTPSADEIAWARRVIDAAAAAHGGAVSLGQMMVDRPVVLRAEAVLRQAGC